MHSIQHRSTCVVLIDKKCGSGDLNPNFSGGNPEYSPNYITPASKKAAGVGFEPTCLFQGTQLIRLGAIPG